MSGWRWLRTCRERAEDHLALPPQMVCRLARRGGLAHPGPGVRFKKREPHGPILTRRLRWVSSTLRARSAPALALQLRQLHAAIQWDAIKRPPPGAPPPPPPPAGSAAATDAVLAAEAAAAAGVPPPESPNWQGAAVRGRRPARVRVGYEYLVGVPARPMGGGHGHHHHPLRGQGRGQDEPTIGSLVTSESGAVWEWKRGGGQLPGGLQCCSYPATEPLSSLSQPTKQPPRPPAFSWIHERLLPLWLVKGYEEAVRKKEVEIFAGIADAEAEDLEYEALVADDAASKAATKASKAAARAERAGEAAAKAVKAAADAKAKAAAAAEEEAAAAGGGGGDAEMADAPAEPEPAAEAPAAEAPAAPAADAAAPAGATEPASGEPAAAGADAGQTAPADAPDAAAEEQDAEPEPEPEKTAPTPEDKIATTAASKVAAEAAAAVAQAAADQAQAAATAATLAAAESRARADAAAVALREAESLMSDALGVQVACGNCGQAGDDTSPKDLLWIMCASCSR